MVDEVSIEEFEKRNRMRLSNVRIIAEENGFEEGAFGDYYCTLHKEGLGGEPLFYVHYLSNHVEWTYNPSNVQQKDPESVSGEIKRTAIELGGALERGLDEEGGWKVVV